MKALRKVYDKHYYAIWFFVFLAFYNFIMTNEMQPWETKSLGHAFHLVDFSLGFCTKFLAGAIYNFFFDDTSIEAVSAYMTVLVLCIFLLTALLLERLVLKTENNRKLLLFLILLFISGPATFSMFIYQFGMIDTYWLLFSIMFILCLSTKRLYILLPFIMGLSILLHYAAIVAYIPFFVLLMLYKTTVIEDVKEKRFLWFILILSTVFSLGLTIYFIGYEQGNLTYSLEEFLEIMDERGMSKGLQYYPTSMYNVTVEEVFDAEVLEELFQIQPSLTYMSTYVFYRIIYTLYCVPFEKAIEISLILSPVIVLIFAYFKNLIKRTETTLLKRFTYVAICMMFFVTIVLSVLTSTDVTRWIGEAYMLLMVSFFYVIYYEKGQGFEVIEDKVSKIPKLLIFVFVAMYLSVIINPYCQMRGGM